MAQRRGRSRLVILSVLLVFLVGFVALPSITHLMASTSVAMVYYISPAGNDTNAGTARSAPLATFDKAWEKLYPGDTLVVLDGVYYQRLNPNKRNGQPGNPIRIRAENDGQVIIDGERDGDPNTLDDRICRPLQLGDTWTGEAGQNPVGNYFVVEGLVVKNGGRDSTGGCVLSTGARTTGNNVGIWGKGNVLRRVSSYNAHPDINSMAIAVFGEGNLLEDCVAAGSGRKMAYVFGNGKNNILRRCFVGWQEFRGLEFNPGAWPWGDNLETYNASQNIIENSIAYGRAPGPAGGINVFGQSGANATNNAVLGSMVVKAGMTWDGADISWPCPAPNGATCVDFSSWNTRNAFRLGDGNGGAVQNNLFQDIFAVGNGGLGFEVNIPAGNLNQLVRGTLLSNGQGQPIRDIYKNKSILDGALKTFSTLADSYIEGTSQQGNGARLKYRYQSSFDGAGNPVATLTTQALWPWPMEERIRAEFRTHLARYHAQTPELRDFSVTGTMMAIFDALPPAIHPLGPSQPTTILSRIPPSTSVATVDCPHIEASNGMALPGRAYGLADGHITPETVLYVAWLPSVPGLTAE
jgi:hypothetical protein